MVEIFSEFHRKYVVAMALTSATLIEIANLAANDTFLKSQISGCKNI